jgi:hypothetical protein
VFIEALLRSLLAGEEAHWPALAHHEDAVAHRYNLRQVGRNQDNPQALRRQVVDHVVHFGFRAHVNASRGFVQNKQMRAGVEPLAQHHLLLIAAGEPGHLDTHRRRANREPFAESLGGGFLGRPPDQT